jgi:transcriptional regulator with XRE-family HTH domain
MLKTLTRGPVARVNTSARRLVRAVSEFGSELARLLSERGMSLHQAARLAHYDVSYLSKVVNGHKPGSAALAAALDELLGAGGALAAMAPDKPPAAAPGVPDDETDAWELARLATASDVGAATLDRIELAVDGLAVAYPGTPPGELLSRVRQHLAYVARLLDARKTLAEHRRLLAAGGWLSLLAGTCSIDLHLWDAASARLGTAAELARETGHAELAAWCLETRAWQLLTTGDYPAAATLARGAQQAAPRGTSVAIQATAQEGRALARLGASGRVDAYAALSRVDALVSPLPVPWQPEHHYRYDPAKSESYAATTLSWLGDPAGERVTREVLGRLESAADGPPRPRRAALARVDLALSLLAAGKADEAAAAALEAVTSGQLVPSHYWRAREVVEGVESSGTGGAAALREAYGEFCGPAAPARREITGPGLTALG